MVAEMEPAVIQRLRSSGADDWLRNPTNLRRITHWSGNIEGNSWDRLQSSEPSAVVWRQETARHVESEIVPPIGTKRREVWPMRRALSLLFALALLAGGIYVLSLGLFRATRWIIFLAGCTMAGLGACWLWADFLSPKRERS